MPISRRLRSSFGSFLTNPSVTIWSIWMTLVDERDAEVPYGTVRDYVTIQRRRAEWTRDG